MRVTLTPARIVLYSVAGMLLAYLGWAWFDLNNGSSPAVSPTSSLGLLRQQWESEHGSGEESGTDGWRRYTQKRGDDFTVAFWYGRVSRLTWQWGEAFGRDIDAAREATGFLRPSDAVLVQTYTPRENTIVDVYTSAWLQELFPATDPNVNPWLDDPPGTFTVVYHEEAGEVASVTIALANNP